MGMKPRGNGGPAKVSARAAGKSVDDYLAGLPAAQARLASDLRALVRDSAPGITETIKWGRPVWESNGPFAYFQASAKHLTFGFWRGAELTDSDGVLQGTGDRMRHIKLTDGAGLPSATLRKLVRQAVALNATKGDPSRRSPQ